jgi:hypothetical protein
MEVREKSESALDGFDLCVFGVSALAKIFILFCFWTRVLDGLHYYRRT